MITGKRKGKGRVKTVVDFGMLDDQTVCRVRTVNGECENEVRRSNAENSIRQLLERTLRMRLTDRPFEKMFTFTIEPRTIRGRVGEESGTMWTEYTVRPGCVSMVLDTAMEIYRSILNCCSEKNTALDHELPKIGMKGMPA